MPPIHQFLKTARLFHLYLGVFTAPMLLFFAITGGLQTFSLHETTRGSSYQPPAWLASAAQLHKKQTVVLPVRRPRPVEVPPAPTAFVDTLSPAGTTIAERAAPASDRLAGRVDVRPKKNLLPMKLFFALVSLGLLLSTLTGLFMAYRYSRKPRLVNVTLAAGIAVPLLLLVF